MAGSEHELKSLLRASRRPCWPAGYLNTQYESLGNTSHQCGYHTGTVLRTAALPAVTQEQLDAMDYGFDLKEIEEQLFDLGQAGRGG